MASNYLANFKEIKICHFAPSAPAIKKQKYIFLVKLFYCNPPRLFVKQNCVILKNC